MTHTEIAADLRGWVEQAAVELTDAALTALVEHVAALIRRAEADVPRSIHVVYE